MKKLLIAVMALSFMAVSSGLVMADGSTPATGAKKSHPKHNKKKGKKSASKPAAPASTPSAK
jgi:hypothetical protein